MRKLAPEYQWIRPPRGCPTKKQRFPDKLAADYTLATIRWLDRPNRPHLEIRSYLCPHCDGWHLTHRKAWMSQ